MMKLKSVLFAALVGLLTFVTVNSQTTPGTISNPAAQAGSQLWDQMKQLRSDLKNMKSSGNIDDQKLITDVSAVVNTLQNNVKLLPASLQSEATAQVSNLQSQVQAMVKTGKFDPSIIKSIRDSQKSAREAIKASRNA